MSDAFSARDFKIDLILVPSLEEIEDDSVDDMYLCSLAPFHRSVMTLVDECNPTIRRSSPIGASVNRDLLGEVRRKGSRRNAPVSIVFEISVIFGTTAAVSSMIAASTLLYKLLKTWKSLRNGRRINLKLPDGFHIDTTQLSPRQFVRLVKNLAEFGLSEYLVPEFAPPWERRSDVVPKKKEKSYKRFLKELSATGSTICDEKDREQMMKPLAEAYYKVRHEMRNGPGSEQRGARIMKSLHSQETIPQEGESKSSTQLKEQEIKPRSNSKPKRLPAVRSHQQTEERKTKTSSKSKTVRRKLD